MIQRLDSSTDEGRPARHQLVPLPLSVPLHDCWSGHATMGLPSRPQDGPGARVLYDSPSMSETSTETTPISHTDPVNVAILRVSEDQLQGFVEDPMTEIATRSDVDLDTVIERIAAMLRAGTIRRVRQTLMATNLAKGALVAWQVPNERIDEIFDFMFRRDPFSGHVVVRSTDSASPGSTYRLWTTVKVPKQYSLEKHCELLRRISGAERFVVMPARKIFALGVGHVRRKGMEPGSRGQEKARVQDVSYVDLGELEWRVLMELKRELEPDEIRVRLWEPRAAEAGIPLETFYRTADALNEKGVIGRFSTFLEHVKPTATGERVTRFNALFHWAVMPGEELDAGREVGRHHIITHCYWREGGPEFRNVNIMAVAHGTDKQKVLEHKAAIDLHLQEEGISFSYTNVFWGGRSEIKPSEISPFVYREWAREMGVDPASLEEKTNAE